MIRKNAIKITSKLVGDAPIISANGFISRDLFEVNDKNSNFYMIGSMGLASSIGLGIALKKTKKKLYIFDGDGNIMMNLGTLVTIGSLKPKNLVHIVFDNNSHESTGGQPTNSKNIKIDNIANETNFKTFQVNTKDELEKTLKKIKNMAGPIFLLIKVSKSKRVSKRVSITPTQIKTRFMNSLQ
tara:strand:- start:299 stop:850 length:552 start_codon:yes stop_codon:yes gene_type:complete